MQLNTSMRIISGTSVLLWCWLLVLCSTVPPHLRREVQTRKLLDKVVTLPELPLASALLNPLVMRRPSRHPVWEQRDWAAANAWLPNHGGNIRREDWEMESEQNKHLFDDPTRQAPGFDLPRCQLNRFCTAHGLYVAMEHVWGICDHPLYACGQERTILYIVASCPLMKLSRGLVQVGCFEYCRQYCGCVVDLLLRFEHMLNNENL
jgi:hypothetical protein